MELYVKEQFTKAIAICGDKPEYENVKDVIQDMIDENVAMAAKDTPVHMLKFMQTVAYNPQFTEEFRECMENVLYVREIDDKATTFLVRKLRILCDTREEDIKKKDERIHELERIKSERQNSNLGVNEELVDELKKRIEENEKRIKVCELEELVDELEKRVEKLREINDKLLEENHDLREKIGEY